MILFIIGLCQDIPLTVTAGIGGGIYRVPNFVSENEGLVFESRELYGLQWDLFSISYLLELNINFAYMYFSDKTLDKIKDFAIPGLGVGLSLSDLFKDPLKYISLDLGLHRQYILPDKMYDSEFNRIDGYFVTLNLLIPYIYNL